MKIVRLLGAIDNPKVTQYNLIPTTPGTYVVANEGKYIVGESGVLREITNEELQHYNTMEAKFYYQEMFDLDSYTSTW